MNCEDLQSRLSAYIDGEVSAEEAELIREHLSICSDCAHEEELLCRTSDFLSRWKNLRAPDGFCEALLAKADDPSFRPRRIIRYAVRPFADPKAFVKMAFYGAAVLLLCVGVIFFASLPFERTPMVTASFLCRVFPGQSGRRRPVH